MKSLLAVSLQWIHSIISSTELATPTEAEFSSLVSTSPLLPSGAKIGCRTFGFTISNETNRLQHRTQTREGVRTHLHQNQNRRNSHTQSGKSYPQTRKRRRSGDEVCCNFPAATLEQPSKTQARREPFCVKQHLCSGENRFDSSRSPSSGTGRRARVLKQEGGLQKHEAAAVQPRIPASGADTCIHARRRLTLRSTNASLRMSGHASHAAPPQEERPRRC